jgi:hypothetical protein
MVGHAGHALLAPPDRSVADHDVSPRALPNGAELSRQRLDLTFHRTGLGEARGAERGAPTIAAVDRAVLRFRREAGLISRRHVSFSPVVRFLVTELCRNAQMKVALAAAQPAGLREAMEISMATRWQRAMVVTRQADSCAAPGTTRKSESRTKALPFA